MSFQPVPTYAELAESRTDPKTGVTTHAFNPVWLSWFLSLSETTGNSVQLALNASLSGNAVVLGDGANRVTAVGGLGNVGDVLTSQGSLLPPDWQPTAFVNPLTTKGDIVYESSAPAPAALAIGTTGQFLTVFNGLPAWTGTTGRAAAQTGAVASVAALTVGIADASYLVSANILVTTSTLHSFSCTCSYTDEGGSSRVLTLNFSQITGAFVTTLTNALGTGAYEGVQVRIRAKASTTITIATAGTFTTVAYNVEAGLMKVS